jgi:hypothetical protein
VEVPSQTSDSEGVDTAGIWHQKWNQSQQAQWIAQFYSIALSKPFVNTVTYSNLADTKEATIANSGLLTEKLEPKESLLALKKLHKLIFSR